MKKQPKSWKIKSPDVLPKMGTDLLKFCAWSCTCYSEDGLAFNRAD